MFFLKGFVLVLFYFPFAEVSHDTELACGSVHARTLFNRNNQDFSRTDVRRRTWVVSDNLTVAAVVVAVFHQVHGRGM